MYNYTIKQQEPILDKIPELVQYPGAEFLSVAAGQLVFSQDQFATGAYFVIKGEVSGFSILPRGQKIKVMSYHEGRAFGFQGLLSGYEMNRLTTVAAVDSLILFVPTSQLNKLLKDIPQAWEVFLTESTYELNTMERKSNVRVHSN